MSRSVSMGCQKPLCRKAASSPSAARLSSGADSQGVASLVNPVDHLGLQNEKAAIDIGVVARRFFNEFRDLVAFQLQCAIAAGRDDGGQGRLFGRANLWKSTSLPISMLATPSP